MNQSKSMVEMQNDIRFSKTGYRDSGSEPYYVTAAHRRIDAIERKIDKILEILTTPHIVE
jgi:hypothetical protein